MNIQMIAQGVANALGITGIGGKTVCITPTITTTATQYTSGDVVGGAIKLSDVFTRNYGTSILKSVVVKDSLAQSADFTILLFNENPTAATTADNGAFAYSTDFSKNIAKFNVVAADYETIDSKSIANLDSVSTVLKGGSTVHLWMVIVTTGTPTFGANNTSLYVTIGFLQD